MRYYCTRCDAVVVFNDVVNSKNLNLTKLQLMYRYMHVIVPYYKLNLFVSKMFTLGFHWHNLFTIGVRIILELISCICNLTGQLLVQQFCFVLSHPAIKILLQITSWNHLAYFHICLLQLHVFSYTNFLVYSNDKVLTDRFTFVFEWLSSYTQTCIF